ncbi:efflux RND transporter periplasmic adaptor subunit [Pseudochrobactrum asaccharolyticum]|uniref:Multidrug efflux system membrane fusion protein n=1 Tax=Pseudochrobactrum asaccharolyticum TaxID=354351 RepID=A0A366DTS6_9HYPH|nr:efflux RND transporter periplasmic adaptor subunit [Pseudochrobactrum asaccharolyticum]RBO93492.1 multidrug efflux system membrane fusion protein [Pseudochrobactrum asaccharolyticum]
MPYLQQCRALLRSRLSFVMAALAAIILTACSDDNAQTAAAVPPVNVNAAPVLVKSIRQWDEFSGRIASTDAVEVRTRVSGYIERIAFKDGDEVKQGDLLFVIDRRPYQAAYDSAFAKLERTRAAAQLARVQEERARALIVTNAIPRGELDTRRAALNQREAEVRADEADLEIAKLNLSFTEVRSPISGRIGRAMLTVGNLAQADQSVLTNVVSQNPVYIYFQPDEQTYLRYLALSRTGERQNTANPVRIALASDTTFPYAGTVDFINNQVDPATGTITLRAVVPNPDRILVPGLYARVQLEGSAEFDAMLVDDKAILTDQDRKYVYVIGANNDAVRKDVVLSGFFNGLRIVQAGLSQNDNVIVSGVQKIFSSGIPVNASKVVMGMPASAAAQ